jgi:hypothetical protein
MEPEKWKERDRRRRKRNIIILSLIVLAASVWFWLTLSKTTEDQKKVWNWLQTPCVIKSVKIDVDPLSQIANFYWVISYEYEYDGHNYTSNKYSIVEKNKIIGGKEKEEIMKARQENRRIHEPYTVGGKVSCFVNPNNPSESVIVRQIRGKDIIKRLLAPGIMVIGYLIVILIEIWNHYHYDKH